MVKKTQPMRIDKHPSISARIHRMDEAKRPKRASFIRGRPNALPSNTRGGSRVREFRSLGSVRGVRGNAHPYRSKPGSWGTNPAS